MRKAITTIAAFAAIMTACSQTASLSGEWTVLTIKGESVSAAIETPAITISGDDYHGVTGVNLINGKISVKGGNVRFEDGAMTRRAGDPESMAIEMRYLEAINSASKATVNESVLTLTDENGEEVMTLKKK